MASREKRWQAQSLAFRDPAKVIAQWPSMPATDPALLRSKTKGDFWGFVEEHGPLVVSREYEHLVLVLSAVKGRPKVWALPLPHPNGMAVDPKKKRLYVASTRNPNMVYSFASDSSAGVGLRPDRAWYYPGELYVHDLALVGGKLYANAVGRNTVVELFESGGFMDRWWPRSVMKNGKPRTDQNFIQLNSIGAGPSLGESYFSASAEAPISRRPGDPRFPVDRKGVIFSGKSRQVICRDLTRPHSARLHGGTLYVDNSGYGEFGAVEGGRLEPLARLSGWTRGLLISGNTAFVGTSRVLPRFRSYAPGLDLRKSACSIQAIDIRSGKTRGSITWPEGNQIFAIESLSPIL